MIILQLILNLILKTMNKFIHNITQNNTIIDIKDSIIAIAALLVITIITILMLIKEIIMYIGTMLIKHNKVLISIAILIVIFTLAYILIWFGWIMSM